MMPRLIDGATRLMGIVGDPVAQVRSPVAWCGLFRRNAINAVCVPMHVRAADLDAYFAGLRTMGNLFGLIITIPHKVAAVRYVDECTERARLAGSVNLIRMDADGRRTGDIVDGVGFVRALEAAGKSVAGKRALVVGAGGVGTAIAFAIATAGAATVDVSDLDAARAAGLSRRLADYGVGSQVVAARGAGYDLAVNASPLGMRAGDPLAIDLAGVTAATIIADVVNVAHMTPILLAAQALGCHVQRGVEMMEHQVAPTAEFLGFSEGDWSAATVRTILAEDSAK
jgi:shikimate dehydrogenase